MDSELITLPRIVVSNDVATALPLEHTDVSARITGLIAEVTVLQRFRNPLTKKADLEYLFPLPHLAVITAFEFRIGIRVITGGVYEIEQAIEGFDRARKAGQRASLLEQRRPDLFALKLANIQPGEIIQVVTSYQQALEVTGEGCEFVYPMGITPRYHKQGDEAQAELLDAPIATSKNEVGDVEITVTAELGSPAQQPVSPSHPLRFYPVSASSFHVSLDGIHLPDRDFVLRWQYVTPGIQFPAWGSTGDSDWFMASFIPPFIENSTPVPPREYIFVLDHSGSMEGQPIQQAVNALRACLRTLSPRDTFAILLFDHQVKWLCQPTVVDQAAIDLVDKLLNRVHAEGGTEIEDALNTAFQLTADPHRQRMLLFLTDGAVSAEKQILNRLNQKLGEARLFTFGIGSSVNRSFLDHMAKLGRGECTFIGNEDEIEEAILRFQDSISNPLITDLRIICEGGRTWDVYPALLPDLYAGHPLQVTGRWVKTGSSEIPAVLKVTGLRDGAPVEMSTALTEITDSSLLSRLWTQARVENLLEQEDLGMISHESARQEIIPLAVKASIASRYTGFLAVDSLEKVEGGSIKIRVAQPLPSGLNFAGSAQSYFPASPSTKIFYSQMMPLSDMTDNSQTLYQIKYSPEAAQPMQPEPFTPENVLRELARSQKLDGSWDSDVEMTAAALLAFVRAGFSTHKGIYRQQLKRAFAWLTVTAAPGFAGLLRAQALQELVDLTHNADQLLCAQDALKSAGPDLVKQAEKLLANKNNRVPNLSLDELRMSVIARIPGISPDSKILIDPVGRILAAALIH